MAKPAKAVFGQEENPTQKRVGDLAVHTTVSETASGSRLHVMAQKLNGKNEKKKKRSVRVSQKQLREKEKTLVNVQVLNTSQQSERRLRSELSLLKR